MACLPAAGYKVSSINENRLFFFLKGKKLFLSVQRQSKVYLSSKMKLGNTSKKKIIYSVKIKKE